MSSSISGSPGPSWHYLSNNQQNYVEDIMIQVQFLRVLLSQNNIPEPQNFNSLNKAYMDFMRNPNSQNAKQFSDDLFEFYGSVSYIIEKLNPNQQDLANELKGSMTTIINLLKQFDQNAAARFQGEGGI